MNKEIDYAATVDEYEAAQGKQRFADSVDSWEAAQSDSTNAKASEL